MKKLALLSIVFFVVSSLTFGQYAVGKKTAGAFVGIGGGGLSGTGGAPIAVEYNFMNYEKNIQIGGVLVYASTTEDFSIGKWTYTNIVIAAQANYHFFPGEKFDPFAGITLGYDIVSSSTAFNAGYSSFAGMSSASASTGGFVYSGQVGFNYWFSPKFAGQVRLGYFPYLAAGVTFVL